MPTRQMGLNWISTLVALICATLIQIGTNFANDYFDFVKGSDTDERIGFRRATAAGLMLPQTHEECHHSDYELAFLTGLYLVSGGWMGCSRYWITFSVVWYTLYRRDLFHWATTALAMFLCLSFLESLQS
ncbi:hypothetical protein [Rhodohalobacter sp.]|uniref:hypothetical protein n=1 Tax=Rhodohalobacter sp. TaxID=1974210 RepID=UPI002ACEB628|nr:hypothetical protein [Rhodohalobacter sp.]